MGMKFPMDQSSYEASITYIFLASAAAIVCLIVGIYAFRRWARRIQTYPAGARRAELVSAALAIVVIACGIVLAFSRNTDEFIFFGVLAGSLVYGGLRIILKPR